MRAPVGHCPAGVIVPIPEIQVAALRHVFHLRRLAKPEIPVQFLRHRLRLERAFAQPRWQPYCDFLELADSVVSDQLAREAKAGVAALLGPRLKNGLVLADRFDDVFALVDSES